MSRSLTLISQMMQLSLWRLEILLGALEVLNEELNYWLSLIRIYVQQVVAERDPYEICHPNRP